jgi:hypothetical protein
VGDIGDPDQAMRLGIIEILGMHLPTPLSFGADGKIVQCSCGDRFTAWASGYQTHVARLIVDQFLPATLEVTDRQARIDELLLEMEEWVAGSRSNWNSFAIGDPERRDAQLANCAIADAQEVVKRSALVKALVAVSRA